MAAARRQPILLVACLLVANLPDVDFIPGLMADDPALYHQGVTHSVAFVLLAAGVASGGLSAAGLPWTRTIGVLLAAGLTHLVLDALGGSDSRPPFGVPLLWPLSDLYVQSPVPLLIGVQHETTAGAAAWIRSLISPFNVLAIGLEALLTAPLLWLGLRRRAARP